MAPPSKGQRQRCQRAEPSHGMGTNGTALGGAVDARFFLGSGFWISDSGVGCHTRRRSMCPISWGCVGGLHHFVQLPVSLGMKIDSCLTLPDSYGGVFLEFPIGDAPKTFSKDLLCRECMFFRFLSLTSDFLMLFYLSQNVWWLSAGAGSTPNAAYQWAHVSFRMHAA